MNVGGKVMLVIIVEIDLCYWSACLFHMFNLAHNTSPSASLKKRPVDEPQTTNHKPHSSQHKYPFILL